MRIAFIFSKFPPMEDGGADYLAHLAAAITKQGHKVGIFTSEYERIKNLYPDDSQQGYQVFPIIRDWRLPIFSPSSSLNLIKGALVQFQPDIVQITFPDSVLLNNYQIPFVLPFVQSAPVVTLFFSFFLRYSNWVSKLGVFGLMISSSVIIVHTEYLRDLLLKYLPFLFSKTRVIPVGDNLEDTDKVLNHQEDELMKKLGLRKDYFTIGFYGGIDPSKGVEDLLKALKLLIKQSENVQLLFVGGRSNKSEYSLHIEALIQSLNLGSHIIHTGYLSRSIVPDHLRLCDICVLPFRKNVLGRSSLVSALSMGLPTITTRPSHKTEYLKHRQNIYIVNQGQPAELANAIIEIKNDYALRQSLSKGAQLLSKEFSWDSIAEKMLRAYEDILK